MHPRKILVKLLFALAALSVFVFSYYLGNRYARPGHDTLQAFVLPKPQEITSFNLVDKEGKVFNEKSFEGHWNFVMAGDLMDENCRSLLVRYVLAWNYLAANPKLQKKTRVVFLDLSDPPMPPEQLKKAIDFFNPAFTALDGPDPERSKLARQLGISKATLDRGTECDSQNSVVALINPDGYLLALFTAVTDPAVIAKDLRFFQ